MSPISFPKTSPVSSASGTPTETPPPSLPLADWVGQVSPEPPVAGGDSPLLLNSHSRRTKTCSPSSTMPVLRRDTSSSSSDWTARLQQEKQILVEEVKAQKVIRSMKIMMVVMKTMRG